jgi:predicted nucleic acid-binding protein
VERVCFVLDSGAVSAIAKGEAYARRLFEEAVRSGTPIVVPAVVVAESARGTARDALANRLLGAVEVRPVDEALARRAGRLLHETGSSGTIDAIVVATADETPGSAILTGDVRDLSRLASARGRTRIMSISGAITRRR